MSLMIAFCGMAAGLSAVLMLTGGVLYIATFIAPLLAAVLLIPVRIEFGWKAALGTWAVTAFLSLILSLDKEAGFFYLFICWWPVAKWPIDFRVRRKSLRLVLKTAVFTLAVAAMYGFLTLILPLNEIVAEFREMGTWMTVIFFVGTVICLLLYDFLLVSASLLYAQRIRPRLWFLRHKA